MGKCPFNPQWQPPIMIAGTLPTTEVTSIATMIHNSATIRPVLFASSLPTFLVAQRAAGIAVLPRNVSLRKISHQRPYRRVWRGMLSWDQVVQLYFGVKSLEAGRAPSLKTEKATAPKNRPDACGLGTGSAVHHSIPIQNTGDILQPDRRT